MAEDEKTEEPTSKRLSDARNDGNVASSNEVNTAVFIIFLLLLLRIGGSFILNQMKELVSFFFRNISFELTVQTAMILFREVVTRVGFIILPFALVMLVVAFLSSYMQIGWLFTTKPLQPKFDSIFNPTKGLKQLFSFSSFKNLLRDIVKIAVVSLVLYFTLRNDIQELLGLVDMSIMQILNYSARLVTKIIINILYFYILIAALDFILTKYQHKKKLKMSKSDIKDEVRQMLGDPKIKNKLRSLMMEESRKRMMNDVPEADVVITNPVHLAIALKYDVDSDEAPLVLAKGKRLIAEKIKEIARKHNIPIVEDKALARLLYERCQIGKEISVEFYSAIAEILANIYKLKNKKVS